MRPPALSETCHAPRLWLWPGQAVYVGASLGLDPHSGSVPCLAVAVDGTFTVRVNGSYGPAVRSALIPPRITHQVVARADRMAFCYLDSGSVRHRACLGTMTATDEAIAYRHRHEDALAGAAETLTDPAGARAWLDLAACPRTVHGTRTKQGDAAPYDPRIRDAVAALHGLDPEDKLSAADLAARVGLSPSRFLHLFRDHTGTSFRRYRLWLRMVRAAALIRDRADLTTAAMDAGFASPSHFSASFHSMFGLRPSDLRGTRIHLAG
ncbi:helix-turn-helix transcriptional regulator [Couchioplanes azureus]|uniref:helix-turn-helix transcriptional regulator n=1 Tax=Couchioplanes caeruleus TaxID=56438 RepID=UPI00167096FF|nr:AraC family transcriptional regulator [Couchioplanes caeruleus]GGQ83028.1 transcriptional regulator [Couchioplanes caeruleus subsp. azureus]